MPVTANVRGHIVGQSNFPLPRSCLAGDVAKGRRV